jgi:acetyl esterase/lipase
MLSEQARQIRASMRREPEAAAAPAPSIEAQRQEWEAAALQAPLPPGVTVTPVADAAVAGAWFDVAAQQVDRVLLLLHGGGFSTGSSVTHRELAARLAVVCKARVLALDYRLAPEHPFPAAVTDSTGAYSWLLREGWRPDQIALVGDSAGTTLVLAALLSLRDQRLPLPAAGILLSPWVDLTVSDPSLAERADRDPMVTQAGLLAAATLYLAGADPRQPLASPIYGDLRGLPPLLAQVGEDEVLLGDAQRLAAGIRAAGGSITLEVWEGMWHVWHGWAGELPEARQAIERIGAFVDQNLAPGGARSG